MEQANIPRPQIPDGDFTMVSHVRDGDEHIQLTYRINEQNFFVLMTFTEALKHADNIKAVTRAAMKAKWKRVAK